MEDFAFWWNGHYIWCTPRPAGLLHTRQIGSALYWELCIDGDECGSIGEARLLEPLEHVIGLAVKRAKAYVGATARLTQPGPRIQDCYGEHFLAQCAGRMYFVAFEVGPNQSMAVPLDWRPGPEPPSEQYWLARIHPVGREDLRRSVQLHGEPVLDHEPLVALVKIAFSEDFAPLS